MLGLGLIDVVNDHDGQAGVARDPAFQVLQPPIIEPRPRGLILQGVWASVSGEQAEEMLLQAALGVLETNLGLQA